MKKNIIIILLSLTATISMAQKADQMALNGNELYRQGDFAGAIHSYESAINQGRTSANLYYNLGNAYYRANEIPHAILNYERALRLKPSMRDAKENLALAQNMTIDRIEKLPKLFIIRLYNNLSLHITPIAWRAIWLVLFALLIATITGIIIGRTLNIRRICLSSAIIIALFILLTTLFLISSTNHFNNHSDAIVMQQSLTVKSSPENQSADKLIIHEGTHVYINETLSEWCKITIDDGTTGWCKADAIERI